MTLIQRSNNVFSCILLLLKLLPSTVKEQMYLQENTVLDQGLTRCCPAPSTSCDIYAFAKFDFATVKEMHLQKTQYLTLTLSRSHKILPSTLYII